MQQKIFPDLFSVFNAENRRDILDEEFAELCEIILKRPEELKDKNIDIRKPFSDKFDIEKEKKELLCEFLAKSYSNGNKEVEPFLSDILQTNFNKNILSLLRYIDTDDPLFNKIIDTLDLTALNDFMDYYSFDITEANCEIIPQKTVDFIGNLVLTDKVFTLASTLYADNIFKQNHPDRFELDENAKVTLPVILDDYKILSMMKNFDLLEEMLDDTQEYFKSRKMIIDDVLFEPKVTKILNNPDLPQHLRDKLYDLDYDLSKISTNDPFLIEQAYNFYSNSIFDEKEMVDPQIKGFELDQVLDTYNNWIKMGYLTDAQELDLTYKIKDIVDKGNRSRLYLGIGKFLAKYSDNENVLKILSEIDVFLDNVLTGKHFPENEYNKVLKNNIEYVEEYKKEHPNVYGGSQSFVKFNVCCRQIKNALTKHIESKDYNIPEDLMDRICNFNIMDIDNIAIYGNLYSLETLSNKIEKYLQEQPTKKNTREYIVIYAARKVGFNKEEIDACIKNYRYVDPDFVPPLINYNAMCFNNEEKSKQYNEFIITLKNTFKWFNEFATSAYCDLLKTTNDFFIEQNLQMEKLNNMIKTGDFSDIENCPQEVLSKKLSEMSVECANCFFAPNIIGLSVLEMKANALEYAINYNSAYKKIYEEFSMKKEIDRLMKEVDEIGRA